MPFWFMNSNKLTYEIDPMKGNHIIEFVLNYSGCSKNYLKKNYWDFYTYLMVFELNFH